RCVRQSVAHVPCEAINKVVLAAMGFISNDDNIPPVRQHRVAVAFLLRKELLDGREDNATGGNGELRPKIGAIDRLNRRLTQQIATASESTEELVVKIVAVCQDNDGRVLHRRRQNGTTGIQSKPPAHSPTLG